MKKVIRKCREFPPTIKVRSTLHTNGVEILFDLNEGVRVAHVCLLPKCPQQPPGPPRLKRAGWRRYAGPHWASWQCLPASCTHFTMAASGQFLSQVLITLELWARLLGIWLLDCLIDQKYYLKPSRASQWRDSLSLPPTHVLLFFFSCYNWGWLLVDKVRCWRILM